jgi:protoheme IX farnesyltransferase
LAFVNINKIITLWLTPFGPPPHCLDIVVHSSTAVATVLDPGAVLLALLLYSWQFPHFFSLAWRLRGDYARAGYVMMSVTDPIGSAQVSLRHAAVCAVVPAACALAGVTSGWFAIDGTALAAVFLFRAWRFSDDPAQGTARDLFLSSLWVLPGLFGLLIFHKKKAVAVEEEKEEQGASIAK